MEYLIHYHLHIHNSRPQTRHKTILRRRLVVFFLLNIRSVIVDEERIATNMQFAVELSEATEE